MTSFPTQAPRQSSHATARVVAPLLLLALGCRNPLAGLEGLRSDDDPRSVSMINLIANPSDFHGKRVQLVGYLHLEFEGDAIYLSRDAWQYGQDKNGLWVSFAKAIESPGRFNDSYVYVEGRFNAERHGHKGLFSGSIDEIDRVLSQEPLEPADPNDPVQQIMYGDTKKPSEPLPPEAPAQELPEPAEQLVPEVHPQGILSKEAIRRVIQRHINEVRLCMEDGWPDDARPADPITVRFVIDHDGSVQRAEVLESRTGSADMNDCVLAAFRRMRFAKPQGGGEVTVTFPVLVQWTGG